MLSEFEDELNQYRINQKDRRGGDHQVNPLQIYHKEDSFEGIAKWILFIWVG